MEYSLKTCIVWPTTLPFHSTPLYHSQELWHLKYTQTQCRDNRKILQLNTIHCICFPIWMSTMTFMPPWSSRAVLLISIQHFQINVYCMLMVLLNILIVLSASTSCLQWLIKLFGAHWTMHFLHPAVLQTKQSCLYSIKKTSTGGA